MNQGSLQRPKHVQARTPVGLTQAPKGIHMKVGRAADCGLGQFLRFDFLPDGFDQSVNLADGLGNGQFFHAVIIHIIVFLTILPLDIQPFFPRILVACFNSPTHRTGTWNG